MKRKSLTNIEYMYIYIYLHALFSIVSFYNLLFILILLFLYLVNLFKLFNYVYGYNLITFLCVGERSFALQSQKISWNTFLFILQDHPFVVLNLWFAHKTSHNLMLHYSFKPFFCDHKYKKFLLNLTMSKLQMNEEHTAWY